MVRPLYAIVENVAALLSRGMGEVCGDLAEIGYDAEWHCIPASAVGAEHERDRIWIIANPMREGLQGRRNAGENICYAPIIREGIGLAYASALTEPRQHWEHQPLLGRGLHGIPDRSHRIEALGNSVYPKIPEIIGRAIITSMDTQP